MPRRPRAGACRGFPAGCFHCAVVAAITRLLGCLGHLKRFRHGEMIEGPNNPARSFRPTGRGRSAAVRSAADRCRGELRVEGSACQEALPRPACRPQARAQQHGNPAPRPAVGRQLCGRPRAPVSISGLRLRCAERGGACSAPRRKAMNEAALTNTMTEHSPDTGGPG